MSTTTATDAELEVMIAKARAYTAELEQLVSKTGLGQS